MSKLILRATQVRPDPAYQGAVGGASSAQSREEPPE